MPLTKANVKIVVGIASVFTFPKKGVGVDNGQHLLAPAKNARYYFSADVDDEISDVKSHRKELRFGTEVVGSFSYSDGFVIREVIYIADQNGYRVISDKMENIPQPEHKEKHSFNATPPFNITSETKSSTLLLHRLSNSTANNT